MHVFIQSLLLHFAFHPTTHYSLLDLTYTLKFTYLTKTNILRDTFEVFSLNLCYVTTLKVIEL